ncbi:MAG: class D sortase [Acidobacteriia bacterium]|nr:class D sortase [Terriglobia bacterium]
MVVRVRLQPLWKLFLGVVADLLIVGGVAGMLVWLWGLSDGAVYQYTQGAQFTREAAGSDFGIAGNKAVADASPRSGFSNWIAPVLPKPDPLLLGRLEIPSVQLTVMMREGIDESSLRKAAGHLPSSALPGEAGNVVVLGHRDTFFRPLRGIAQGDPIRVKTRSGSFQYVVDSIQVVPPEQSLSFQEDMPAKSLTLITCFPFDYVGPAPRRFIVRARMLSKVNDSELDPPVHAASAETSPLERMQ